jgi:hypothetical protein
MADSDKIMDRRNKEPSFGFFSGQRLGRMHPYHERRLAIGNDDSGICGHGAHWWPHVHGSAESSRYRSSAKKRCNFPSTRIAEDGAPLSGTLKFSP